MEQDKTNNNRGNVNDKSKGRNKRSKRSRGNKNPQSKNYQDKFAKQEFDKGFTEGAINVKGSHNDPSWYIPSQQLAKDAATIPFEYQNGRPIIEAFSTTAASFPGLPGGAITPTTPVIDQGWEVPGIMTLTLLHTVGEAQTITDPVNLAGTNLYAKLQQKSGRAPAYDMADLMMNQIAVAEAYSYYAWLTRLYGTISQTDILDTYKPESLVQAMLVNYEDVRSNEAKLRTFINQYAYALTALPLLKNIDYAKRRVFLYESIYKDGASARSQYYMYNPAGFLKLVEGDPDDVVTHLEFVPLGSFGMRTGTIVNSNLLSTDDIISYGWSLVNAVRGSQDIRNITADMLNTFGEGDFFSVNPIAENYTVQPEYSAEVLMQIENAYVYTPSEVLTYDIREDTSINHGNLVFNFSLRSAYSNYVGTGGGITQGNYLYKLDKLAVLNFHGKDSLSIEDALVATRLSSTGNGIMNKVNSVETFVPSTYGTELVVDGVIYSINEAARATTGQQGQTLKAYHFSNSMEIGLVPRYATSDTAIPIVMAAPDLLQVLSRLSCFDWHPAVTCYQINYEEETPTVISQITQFNGVFDLDGWTTVPDDQLKRINRVAIQGLFEVK